LKQKIVRNKKKASTIGSFFLLPLKLYKYIVLLLGSTTLTAQSVDNKTINSTSKTLIIELESINSLEFITINKENSFKIISEDVDISNTPKVYIENEILYVKVRSDSNKISGSEKTKYRAGQPLYPKYTIELPNNINTTVLFDKGRFIANNFKGNLDLHINSYGSVEINKYIGSISIESFSGIIDCTLTNVTIDVETSKGEIVSFLGDNRLKETEISIKGIYKKPNNRLKIRTIHSKVILKPVITRK
jgi:hypothetical protein